MQGYDWGWSRGYGRDFGRGRGMAYGDEYGMRGGGWGGFSEMDAGGRTGGWSAGGMRGGRGYDRGIYGGAYPAYGGYPGGPQRGMYFGGRGYGAGPDRFGRGAGGEYDRMGGGFSGGPRGGYDRGFARGPFMGDEIYREHPELDRPRRGMTGRWPDHGHGMRETEISDGEIRQSVEQNLHQDSWVGAGNIEVEVEDRVVTLRGEVDDYLEARYAWDDAWEAAGVRGVVNQLTVRTDQPMGKHGEPFPQNEGDAPTPRSRKAKKQ